MEIINVWDAMPTHSEYIEQMLIGICVGLATKCGKMKITMHTKWKWRKQMDELEIIQKLDNIIADLLADGLHEIAMNIEIEKQKIAKQFNQAELNSQQIDLEEYL